MSWKQIECNWNAVSRAILLAWGKLSEDDLVDIYGQREQLVSMLQRRYGLSLNVAESSADQFARSLKSSARPESSRQW